MAVVRKFVKWLTGAILAFIMFASGVKPDEAVSNLSEWISKSGIENIPLWVQDKAADKWAFWIAFIIFFVWMDCLLIWPNEKKAIRSRIGHLNSDMTVNEAIHYIGLESKWAWTRSNVGGVPSGVRRLDHLVLLDAFEEFRKAAEQGMISVRGRPMLGTGVVPIEKDYWITAGVHPLSVIGKAITSGQTETQHRGGLEYDTLIVPLDEIEKVWPRAGTLYRKWTDILFWFKEKRRY